MWRIAIGVVTFTACWRGSTKPVDEPVTQPAPGIVILDSAPADALELRVRAIRWACNVTHPRNVETSDLMVPAGRPVKLVVWTPEWPEMAPGLEVSLVGTNVKKPVVKDAPVEIAFRIDAPGTYQWKCPTLVPPWREPEADVIVSDEMRAQQNPIKSFRVMPAAEYDAMLEANDPDLPGNQLVVGRTLYEKKGCVACHTLDGSPRVGPSWKGIWGTSVKLADGSVRTVDADYVKTSILNPTAFARPGYPPAMPSFEGQLRDREIDALVAFIASQK